MHASDRVLIISDRNSVLPDTDVGAGVKRWLHCGGQDMSVWRSISSKVECPFDCCSKEMEHEKDLSTLVKCFGR